MRKSYFLLFGTSKLPEEVAEILRRKFDLEFAPHESSYLGEYLLYSGLFADKITIGPNRVGPGDEWKHQEFKEYPVLIDISNYKGKNADKLSKTNYLKGQFRHLEGITLLREKILEEE